MNELNEYLLFLKDNLSVLLSAQLSQIKLINTLNMIYI